jgi:hypothetical protein
VKPPARLHPAAAACVMNVAAASFFIILTS